MVTQMSPEEYFKESNEAKAKKKKEKEESKKKALEEKQKTKMIFKPGQQPMIVNMPPVKVIVNLDKCPHCGMHVNASAEVGEGGENA